MRSLLLFCTLVATAFAGCAVDQPTPTSPSPSDTPPPVTFYPPASADRLPDPAHDFAGEWDWEHTGIPSGHSISAQHAHSFGLELAAYNPLTKLVGGESLASHDSSYIAIDTWNDTYACVAHWAASGGGGAAIIDIRDPENPVVLSSAESGMYNSDCMFTDDGKYLLVGAYSGAGDAVPGVPPPAGDLRAIGVNVYDITDAASPVFLFHDVNGADGNAYHNVYSAQINGTNYVFQTYTGNILALDPGATSLRSVSKVDVADHDMWVGHHPITGQWIMITGAGGGAMIYDMGNPAIPKKLGEWASDEYTGWHRQWPLYNTVDGRALMMVAGEEGGQTWYTVLDFTDPQDLIELGHWTIPTPLTETQHEFETWDGYVATANYHQGLWLIDIGTMERALNPVTIGYYLPHEVAQTQGGTANLPAYASAPYVWGAAFDTRGYIYTADYTSGFYVLKFDATKTTG